ncbi:hypothetical protein ALC53_02459 [Atta colombica]|uniref:Uncharacterized protein n=1 Tax=Atta colombica TaxID=520822 RepID=A0A195BQR5_9HYME|nr:hypothetical protein ALC53_02459 [Atta colombica]
MCTFSQVKKRYDRPLAITRNTNNSNVNESCNEKGEEKKRKENAIGERGPSVSTAKIFNFYKKRLE